MRKSPPVLRPFRRLVLALACATLTARAEQQTDILRPASGVDQELVPTGVTTTVTVPSGLQSPQNPSTVPTPWSMAEGVPAIALSRTYLPALPPVLGGEPSPGQPLPRAYPSTSADFVGETFYLPYYYLSQRQLLSAKRTQRLTTFRSIRDRLLATLQDRLTGLRTADPTQRQASLGELAAAQAGALQALADEEEAIRQDLTTPKLFKDYAGESSIQVWAPTGPTEEPRALDDNVQAAIRAAQLQDGLSPDQRLLLQEIAIELQLPAEATPASVVFFRPATARLRLPDDPPPALVSRLAVFQQLKAALKTELRDAIVRQQQFLAVSSRTQAYAQLAREQAEKFAQLDALAEEIRPGLAALPSTAAADPWLADAVLTPGLSPAQRRLLFNAVLVRQEKDRPPALAEASVTSTRGPKLEYLAVAAQTDLGQKLAPPTLEKPVYYVAADAGFSEGGTRLAGEQPPSAAAMGFALRAALHRRGYEPATAGQPPSLLLVYHWGYLGVLHPGVSVTGNNNVYPNYHARLHLVAPPRLAEQVENSVVHEPVGAWPPRQADVLNNAHDDRYFVIVSAYDYAGFTRGQQNLLWRVRLSSQVTGVTLAAALPALAANAAPFFGRHLEVAQNGDASEPVARPVDRGAETRARFAVPGEISVQLDLTRLGALLDRERYDFTGERPGKRAQPGSTQATALPRALAERIATYQREKLALQESLADRVKTQAPGEATRRAIETFETENARRIATLNETREAIRSELARLAAARAPAGAGGNQLLDALAREFAADAAQAATAP